MTVMVLVFVSVTTMVEPLTTVVKVVTGQVVVTNTLVVAYCGRWRTCQQAAAGEKPSHGQWGGVRKREELRPTSVVTCVVKTLTVVGTMVSIKLVEVQVTTTVEPPIVLVSVTGQSDVMVSY